MVGGDLRTARQRRRPGGCGAPGHSSSSLESARIFSRSRNNAATCALHSGDLRKATGVLEDLVRSNPATRMHPVLIFNLATLYDLAHGAASARRKKEVLQRVAAIYRAPRLTKPADFRI